MCKNREEDTICDYGIEIIEGQKGRFYCMNIIGQVEGHSVLPSDSKTTKYEHLLPLLVKIQEDKNIDGLLIILNTMGGDVEAGLAISEMIAGMTKPTVSLVIGGGHSIGIPLAVSAEYSFITPTATMMVHPVRITGMLISSPQTFNMLEKMQKRVNQFIVGHSSITEDRLTNIMMNTDALSNDVGTILSGEEAVRCGLINRVGGISDAIQQLYTLCEERKNK
ncbi:MAG: ATP-dependent Clp protease proteolytic subunit [Clostridia bacterium]|nr:ATP-dependent Clp protease proteolytic subunit [Clostridia bacterium]